MSGQDEGEEEIVGGDKHKVTISVIWCGLDCGFLHDHFARPFCTSNLGLTLIFARPLRNFLGLTFPHVQNFKVNPDILLTVGLMLNLL